HVGRHGPIKFLRVEKGHFFADDGLLFDEQHRYHAKATSDATLVTIKRDTLLDLFSRDASVALHFYWYFWKNLSFQIRQANELLKSFFLPQRQDLDLKPEKAKTPALAQPKPAIITLMHEDRRATQLKAVPLEEMTSLIKWAQEELFQRGEFIF